MYNKHEKLTIIAILVGIMEADEIIHPNEMEFLNSIISQFEISESELEQIVEMDLDLALCQFRKFSDDKRLESKKLFMDMARCDGYVDKRELKIINQLFS